MDDDNLTSNEEEYLPVVRTRTKLQPGRAAFVPIVTSPLKDEIDRQLFKDNRPVAQIHEWLQEMGVDEISASMLYRYKRDTETRAVPAIVLETSQEDITRNWTGLSKIIESGLKAIDNGVIPRPSEVLSAIKHQSEMMTKLGIGMNIEMKQKTMEMLSRLVEDIIMPNINEEQRRVIFEAIIRDPELQGWIMSED